MRARFAFALCCAALSCREPTQVTLELSTDAACAVEPLAPLMLVETVVVAGTPDQVKRATAAANTSTSACDGGEIGTIVLYPEGGANDAGVLVIGRLHADGGAPSEAQCLAFANPDPSQPPVDGSSCIVARRRVAFVDHKPLRLPVRLSVACAGFVCGVDQTCVADEGGPRCVSAVVGCDERGNCDAQGGGGVGGAGGAGAGAGGAGGGVEVTVTPIAAPAEYPAGFTHVAGFDPPGEVVALQIENSGLGHIFDVVGAAATFVVTLGVPETTTSAHAMRAQMIGGTEVIAWDVNDRVIVYTDSTGTPYAVDGSLRDFVMTGQDAFLFLDQVTLDVRGQNGNQPSMPVCAPQPGAAVSAMAMGGGQIFIGGDRICGCSSCQTPGAAIADIAAHPASPVAVGVWNRGVSSFRGDVIVSEAVLLDDSNAGQLGFVHVTPAGAVWVAAASAGPQGTFIARGTVDADGNLGPWSRAFVPEVMDGVKSLWATDTPSPAAYVIAQNGQLLRIEGF